jgi:uncharacterized protein
MESDPLFIDTWAWLVLANAGDPAFASVAQIRSECTRDGRMWITTDYILDETITRLFAAVPNQSAQRFLGGIFEASRHGTLDIEPITPQRFKQAWELRLQYKDKSRISFTDFTSFAVMRELRLRHVLTADAHFEHTGLGFIRLA